MRTLLRFSQARFALRMLLRSPLASALAVLSIAAGIGLTTAGFGVIDAVLLRPFAVEDPNGLLRVDAAQEDGQWLSYFNWRQCEAMEAAMAGRGELATYQRIGGRIGEAPNDFGVLVYDVSENFFAVLGVKAALGDADLRESGGLPGVVIGHHLWQRELGGRPEIVGSEIRVDGQPFRVRGVMPPEFTGLVRGIESSIWYSHDAYFGVLGHAGERLMQQGQYEAIARVAESGGQAAAAEVLNGALRSGGGMALPPSSMPGVVLRSPFSLSPARTFLLGGGTLLVLGLLLVVACTNVAQLRVSQLAMRRREIGVRMAIGAGRAQVAGQIFLESALLAAAGAAIGLLGADWLLGRAGELLSAGVSYIDYGIRLDGRVMLFSLGATLLTVLLSSAGPWRDASRFALNELLKGAQEGVLVAGRHSRRWMNGVQIALTVALVGLALLFIQSLAHVMMTRPGFDPSKKLLFAYVDPGRTVSRLAWAREAVERLAAQPGVVRASFARRMMMTGAGDGATVSLEMPGQPATGIYYNNVGPDYFTTVGVRLLAGRGIERADAENAEPVVVVSKALAERFLTRDGAVEAALGANLRIEGVVRRVVGITEDTPASQFREEAAPFFYLPFAQFPSGDLTLLVETQGDPATFVPVFRDEIQHLTPGAHLATATTLATHITRNTAGDRMLANLAGGLGLFAVLLTAAGLFGIVHAAVSQRRREFGLRMALGARPGQIERQVLGESLRLALWWIPVGLLILAVVGRLVGSMLFEADPASPAVFIGAALAAVAVSFASSWLPARRAAGTNPLGALRN